jgi:hypothetical protein
MTFVDELEQQLNRLHGVAHDSTGTRYEQDAAYERLLALQWVHHRLTREHDYDCASCRGAWQL